ncbi:MAG TPA: glycogen-binding domain-containing protein [bacterium]|nr:glycogen-binding domain-containing protein [bacterium]
MKHRGIASVAAVTALILLLAGSAFSGVSKVDGGVEFTYDDPSAGSVSLAGDFNNWNMNSNLLTQDGDGVWRVVVDLDPGDYEYKFVVNGSEWIADPENPRIVGDYGNSGLTIGDGGEPEAGGAAEAISNTIVNSRVMLTGWYRATYDTESEVPSDPRWRLSRPSHEFFIGVNPTVTSVASGSAVVRLSTGFGDYKEISADLYSGHGTLEGGPFSVTGYYNEELLQFDNPLETVGHMDLDYTITEEHIPFGRGAQGIIVSTGYMDFDLVATYSNIYDYQIMNDPSVYDNTETDLVAVRLKRPVGPVTLGATYTSLRDGWWISFENETNTSPDLDEYLENNPESESTWFELSNTESWVGIDADMEVVEGLLNAQVEVARYGFKSLWDVGNKEKVEGESYSNGAIDVPVGETDGLVARGILKSSPLPGLDLRLEITRTDIDGMAADELFVSYGHPHWLALWQGEFIEVKGTNSPLSVNIFGPAPDRYERALEFDAGVGFGIFDALLEYDYDSYEWTYLDVIPGTFGPFYVYKSTEQRIAGKVEADVAERVRVGLEAQMLSLSTDGDAIDDGEVYPEYEEPSSAEMILTADIGLWPDWSLLTNVRFMSYDNVPTFGESSVDFVDDSFVAPYLALAYSPRENVELRVGYGVNPTNYLDTPVEGRENGRERWLSQYLWEHSGHTVLDAEQAMVDARTIGVMAVITF